MQMVKKIVLFAAVILLSIMIFAPKRELYYLLENRLAGQDIIIDNENIESGLLSLGLEHPVLYVKGIKVAEIEKVNLFTLLIYSRLSASTIKVDASLRRWIPGVIERVNIDYQLLSPNRLTLEIEGPFGRATGYLLLKKHLLHLDLTEEKELGAMKNLLKKGEKGWYYETSF